MHIHILGICGTFMGSLAQLAKAAGHSVSGCDANVYPPMSTQLEKAGIVLIEGFDPEQLQPAPDLIVVGNALSRGNPCVEAMLDRRLPYISGPQWLGETILRHKHVLSVAGTHGKTTTSSMLVKILDSAGLEPGFLIGGVPQDTGLSARLSDSDYFVVEADEYDSAFFDKRSKFVHYHSDTLVINNLEFDHADIFDDLAAIQRQFHHCVRTVPSTGTVIYPGGDENVRGVIERGCWSQQQPFGEHSDWHYQLSAADGSKFDIIHGAARGTVSWQQTGLHNVANGLAAVIAACQVGVSLDQACAGLSDFVGVKRRMELIYQDSQVSVYDDFAHHPTAIKTTIAGLRSKVRAERIIAVIEPRSATMRLGIHKDSLSAAVAEADQVLWYQNPRIDWDINAVAEACPVPAEATDSIESLLALTTSAVDSKTHIVIMSNGGFEGFHSRLTKCLEAGS
ncbi:MAG: UDP-N-acetylmuramate:L-alanyl-gamma-D-glutamyl-meso-diaminopimelate ligase [Porticoccaceae bacterium]|jgi:UDP-N-acetylmuramate: L-alanyl-gamma-D-glutamyl-meso-diaminopimelate ligase|nr:UDP-N-acetylmuramate:L-alanyl-gamma-D-glutamyl-meso-diaminopimelate ligase [Porticoccaceae bacterium]